MVRKPATHPFGARVSTGRGGGGEGGTGRRRFWGTRPRYVKVRLLLAVSSIGEVRSRAPLCQVGEPIGAYLFVARMKHGILGARWWALTGTTGPF